MACSGFGILIGQKIDSFERYFLTKKYMKEYHPLLHK